MEPYATVTSNLEAMVCQTSWRFYRIAAFLLFHTCAAFSQTATDVLSVGEYTEKAMITQEDTLSLLRKCILKAQVNAIEMAFGKVIHQKALLNITNSNEENHVRSTETFDMESISNLSGRWLKDAEPPAVEYFHRNGDLWVRVRVKGYVREIQPKRFNEDREALAEYMKQLYLKNPFSDVALVDTYDSRFLVSSIALDPSRFTTTSELYRVASIKAKSQVNRYQNGSKIDEIFHVHSFVTRPGEIPIPDYTRIVSTICETSQGWVNGIEYLTSFVGDDGKLRVFVYIKYLNKLH